MISSGGEQEVLPPLLEREHGLDGVGLSMCCSLWVAPTTPKLTFLFQETDSLEGKCVAKMRYLCFGVPQVTLGRVFPGGKTGKRQFLQLGFSHLTRRYFYWQVLLFQLPLKNLLLSQFLKRFLVPSQAFKPFSCILKAAVWGKESSCCFSKAVCVTSQWEITCFMNLIYPLCCEV